MPRIQLSETGVAIVLFFGCGCGCVILPCFVHALWTKYDKVRPKYGKRGRPAEKVTVVFYFTESPVWERELPYLLWYGSL